mmetsp:Transcript_29744/g.88639  ORF Transcript_29744/g.88639 Transcript_29744/m.88639 type:complete len:270 (-) Transcript_29744:94-903(-)
MFPHDFMCMVRSSLTTKRFLLHLRHANGFSPWKWRRRKCFFAWYFVANSLPQSWHLTGCEGADADPLSSRWGWRGRWVVMWNMRFISRLKTLRQTVQVKACSPAAGSPPSSPGSTPPSSSTSSCDSAALPAATSAVTICTGAMEEMVSAACAVDCMSGSMCDAAIAADGERPIAAAACAAARACSSLTRLCWPAGWPASDGRGGSTRPPAWWSEEPHDMLRMMEATCVVSADGSASGGVRLALAEPSALPAVSWPSSTGSSGTEMAETG